MLRVATMRSMRVDICVGFIIMKTIPLSRRSTRSINTKSERNHKEPNTMALDTDNNFKVLGASGEAIVATDYSISEGAHLQVMKFAFGNSAENIRVSDTDPLPVTVTNTPSVNVSTVAGTVGIAGTVGVFGIAGTTLIGVTATNFGIRALTAGDPTIGLAPGADFVRVVGFSGGYPIGITGSNLGIRSLTAGNNTSGVSHIGADFVRVIGVSGAFPIGITAAGFDIRKLSTATDSVSVDNTVLVNYGTETPFSATIDDGFQTRVLRASTGGDPTTSKGSLSSAVNWVEDTVRVVGLSGAYPVPSLNIGLTNISDTTTRLPFRVDSTGALYVALAAGTIGVTAQISGADFRLTGISLASATAAAMTIQVNGYTGPGAIAIGVTATDFDIRNLTMETDSVFAQTRVLSGACGDEVGITGFAHNVMLTFNKTFATVDDTMSRVMTDDINASFIKSGVDGLCAAFAALQNKIVTSDPSSAATATSAIDVNVRRVDQPTGLTSGKVSATSVSAAQLGSFALKSGIHIKSDLVNTTSTVFIGHNSTALNGYALFNGDQIFIETDNTNRIWISATVAGATVYYIGT